MHSKSGALPVAKAPSDMDGGPGEIRGVTASDPDPQNSSERQWTRYAARRGAHVRQWFDGKNTSKPMKWRKWMSGGVLCADKYKIT